MGKFCWLTSAGSESSQKSVKAEEGGQLVCLQRCDVKKIWLVVVGFEDGRGTTSQGKEVASLGREGQEN